jgi:uncharacterized protein YndB with AHSA1/START domain
MIDWLPPDLLRGWFAYEELFALRRARASVAISNTRLIAGRWPDNAQRVILTHGSALLILPSLTNVF